MDSKKSFLPKHFSARKRNWKKKTKDITFTQKVWKAIVPGGGNPDLFLTGHNSGRKTRSDECVSVFYSP